MARSNIIPFRIRKGKDDDLKAEFEKIDPKIDKADIIREALRVYFGLERFNPLCSTLALPDPEKRHQRNNSYVDALKNMDIPLLKKEQSAEDLDDALNSLLDDF